jgi:hypothetical protein
MRGKIANQHPKPVKSLNQAKQSWFVLSGTAHSVEKCSTAQFKAFLKPFIHLVRDADTVGMYKKNTLDIFEKWYMLCSIPKACTALYSTQSEAEQAIEQVVVN